MKSMMRNLNTSDDDNIQRPLLYTCTPMLRCTTMCALYVERMNASHARTTENLAVGYCYMGLGLQLGARTCNCRQPETIPRHSPEPILNQKPTAMPARQMMGCTQP